MRKPAQFKDLKKIDRQIFWKLGFLEVLGPSYPLDVIFQKRFIIAHLFL